MIRINSLIFNINLNLIILMFSIAHATTPITEPPPTVTTDNPTGRTLDISLPLRVNAKLLSEIEIRIQPDGEILLTAATLYQHLSPILKPEGVSQLQIVPVTNGYQSLRQLNATGLNIVYDALRTEIVLQLNTEQAQATTISLGRGQVEPIEPTPTQGFSGFINLYNSVHTDYNPKTHELFEYQSNNFRILTDGAFNYGNLSLIGEGSFDNQGGLIRTGTRFNYDHFTSQNRIQFGDVSTSTIGTQNSTDLFGFTITHATNIINAGIPHRPTGSQSFHLDTPAQIEIFLNQIFTRRLDLPAGDYSLQDLGLGTGANNIDLFITDQAGRKTQLNFNLFIGNEQLATGINEYNISIGFPTQSSTSEISYDSTQFVYAAYYRQGITDWLTLGANVQSTNEKNHYGTELNMISSWGSIALDSVYVQHKPQNSMNDVSGIDFRLRYSQLQYHNTETVAHNGLGFTLEKQTQPLTTNAGTSIQYRLSTTFWQDLIYDYRLNLSVTNSWGHNNTTDTIATLSRRYRNFNATLAIGQTQASGFYTQLGIDFNFGESTNYRQVSINHDSSNSQTQVNYSNMGSNQIGATGYQVNLTHNKTDTSIDTNFSYRANRVDLESTYQLTSSGAWDNVISSRSTYRANTALVYADGSFTLSRPVTDSFAVLSQHRSIVDKKLKIGNFQDHIQYQSDWLGPAVINELNSYSKRIIKFDIDDLPMGYDLGASNFSVTPRYKSGYRFNVGTDYAVILVAELVDKEGKIMALKVGSVIELAMPEKAPLQAFTNKKGRLVVQGLRPGKWQLKFRDEKGNEIFYNVDIPESATGVLRIKTLSP